MKFRLHFGLVVILLAFLVTYLEQSTLPNQQIIIEFSDNNITEVDAEVAIKQIRKQLRSVGIDFIKINQSKDSRLKITYYSATDVSQIESLLAQGQYFQLTSTSDENQSDRSTSKDRKAYQFNISEIQNPQHINWDFERTEIVQVNKKSENSFNERPVSSGAFVTINRCITFAKFGIQIRTAQATVRNDYSYMIPEVRAGPFLQGII